MILVDTDVLVWALRGSAPAQDWLRDARAQGPLGVSVITVVELTGGMRSAARPAVWSLLAAFRPQAVDEVIARRAGELRREWRASHSSIGIADYLVAATAETIGARLATLNVKHFPMFEGIQPPFRL